MAQRPKAINREGFDSLFHPPGLSRYNLPPSSAKSYPVKVHHLVGIFGPGTPKERLFQIGYRQEDGSVGWSKTLSAREFHTRTPIRVELWSRRLTTSIYSHKGKSVGFPKHARLEIKMEGASFDTIFAEASSLNALWPNKEIRFSIEGGGEEWIIKADGTPRDLAHLGEFLSYLKEKG
jgi:hypothetical protein